MTRPKVDDAFVKELAELLDGDSWLLADRLVDHFPPDEWGDGGSHRSTGLWEALDLHADALRHAHGIEVRPSTLREARATALAWPDATRVASYSVHRLIRGEDRSDRLARYAKRNRGKPLTASAVRRFRAEERPAAPVTPWETKARRRIEATTRRVLLEGIVANTDDWWTFAGPDRRRVVAQILKDLARGIGSDL